jgi:hypothetical protein
MKDPYQVLSQKEMDIERVRREIEALHFVIPLLAEDADWVENGLASYSGNSEMWWRGFEDGKEGNWQNNLVERPGDCQAES